MPETLHTCPLCKRYGFSARGLQGHRCPELPRATATTCRQRLPAPLVEAVIANNGPELARLLQDY
jgi:hypothetical protein